MPMPLWLQGVVELIEMCIRDRGIAAHIINFVVITSATSSANSGIFSTSRMAFGLARERSAPQFLGKISKNGVPRNALFLSAVMLLSSIMVDIAASRISNQAGYITLG